MPYPFKEVRKLFYQFTTGNGIVYDANFVEYGSLHYFILF